MFGFDFLAIAASGYLELAQNTLECKTKAAPRVRVSASTKDVRYNFKKTKNQLAATEIDTISPYAHDQETFVGGLMNGQIEVKTNVKLGWEAYPSVKKNCYWYDEVNLHMEIDPIVFVAKEFPRGTCEHKEILKHEQKHVGVDRIIVKKYRKMMEQYLNQIVKKVPVYGPESTARAPMTRKKMSDYIEAAVTKVSDKMYAERRVRQQSIDSHEEYERVAAACRDSK